MQVVEYRHQGNTAVGPWVENSLAELKTESAHRLATAALAGQPLGWLHMFQPPQ